MRNLAHKVETKSADLDTDPIADVRTALDGLTADVETKTAPVADLTKRLDAIEAKANRLAADNDNKANDDIEAKALNSWLRTGQVPDEVKTLTVGTAGSGGYTTAPAYSTNILKKIDEINPLRRLSSVMSIGTSKVYIPVLSTDASVSWVTETGNRAKTEPTFSQIEVDVFEQSCAIPVSRQLLEDSFLDLQSFLAERMAVKFAEAEADAFLSGSGSGQPSGVLDNTSIVEVDETATILEDIVSLFYKLKSGYAARGSFLMNRSTMAAIRKAADVSTARSAIWSDSLAQGQPAMLLGRPVYEASGLDDHGDDSSGRLPSVLFGDFATGYQVVDRVPGVQILRDDYTSASTGVVNFWARRRVGGSVVQPEAIVALNASN